MNPPPNSTTRKARKVRYHDHEWERILRHARACGLPAATFVRQVSLGVQPRARRNRTENELILRLGRIATDLQQLVRLAERGSEVPPAAEVERVLNDVLAAVRRVG